MVVSSWSAGSGDTITVDREDYQLSRSQERRLHWMSGSTGDFALATSSQYKTIQQVILLGGDRLGLGVDSLESTSRELLDMEPAWITEDRPPQKGKNIPKPHTTRQDHTDNTATAVYKWVGVAPPDNKGVSTWW